MYDQIKPQPSSIDWVDLSNLMIYQFILDGICHMGLVASMTSEGFFLELPETWFRISEWSNLKSVQIKHQEQWLDLTCEIAYINTDGNSVFPIGIAAVFIDRTPKLSLLA